MLDSLKHCGPFDPSWGSGFGPVGAYSSVGIYLILWGAPEAVFRKSLVQMQQLFIESTF